MMAPPMNGQPCPDDALLGALIDGTLAEGTRVHVVGHVDRCARCRAKVSDWLARVPVAETKASAVPDLPGEGATIAGRYALGRMLGRGGMGVVHEAIQLDLGRPVAVKLLPPTADATASSRFAREARTLAQLAHPNIVQIFDYGTDLGTAYVVMERLEGRPLSTALRADGPFDAARAVRIASEMLRALSVTHRAGVVHRDIKPANVFLLPDDWVKLLDFGIASTNDGSPRLTMTGMTLGTPAYMAPEQVLAGAIDGRTDLYAVGVCLFEMLTGRRPFNAPSSTQVIAQIIQGGPPRADAVCPGIPPRLADVIERAMARDPAGRFANAETFAGALGISAQGMGAQHLSARPASYAPPPSAYPPTASPTFTSAPIAPTRDMTAPLPPPRHAQHMSVAPAMAATVAAAPGRSWVAPILGLIAVLLLGLVAVGAFVAYKLTSASAVAGPAGAPDASAPADAATPGARASSSPSSAPAPSTPQGKATAPPRAATAAATSANCGCVNAAGGPICTTPRIPDCDCNTSGGVRLCPQPWNAAERCPVGNPSGSGTSAYSGAGKKHGDSCSGFELISKRASDGGLLGPVSSPSQLPGKLNCSFCTGLGDRFAGVNGASCRGTTGSSNGVDDIREGTVVCK
jgi:eukaryotic-like serine/threonine-protein kinase